MPQGRVQTEYRDRNGNPTAKEKACRVTQKQFDDQGHLTSSSCNVGDSYWLTDEAIAAIKKEIASWNLPDYK